MPETKQKPIELELSFQLPAESQEAQNAFGPHRKPEPGEVFDPEDQSLLHKTIPTRKYGPGSQKPA